MGIFARLAALIKANINDLISQAEDPIKMLDQAVIDMANQLIEAKKQVAIAIADEKRLAKQAEAEAAKAAEWERRAMMAVRAGDDTLAMEALQRKKEHEGLAVTYKEQWAKQKKQVDQLKMALRVLNSKIEEAKRKKQVLKAQFQRAKATKHIQETLAGLNENTALDAFQRAEDKVLQMEAEAEATGELAEEYSGDVLEHRFAKMEVNQGATDDLELLKQKMGLAPVPEPTPEQVRVEADAGGATDELAELSQAEQDELAAALAELDEQEQAEQARMKR
jgi:phage shock protein A